MWVCDCATHSPTAVGTSFLASTRVVCTYVGMCTHWQFGTCDSHESPLCGIRQVHVCIVMHIEEISCIVAMYTICRQRTTLSAIYAWPYCRYVPSIVGLVDLSDFTVSGICGAIFQTYVLHVWLHLAASTPMSDVMCGGVCTSYCHFITFSMPSWTGWSWSMP